MRRLCLFSNVDMFLLRQIKHLHQEDRHPVSRVTLRIGLAQAAASAGDAFGGIV